MALPRKRKRGGAQPQEMPFQAQNSLSVEAFNALDGAALNAAGEALTKGANLLADGGSVIGGLAKSGLRAARAVPLDSALEAVTNVTGDAVKAVGPAANAALGAAGDVLSGAAGLAGPAAGAVGDVAGDVLGAAGDVAGEVIGAVVEAAGDALS